MNIRQILLDLLEEPEPIEFLCEPRLLSIIPEPKRASSFTPTWFKKLPGKIDSKDILHNSTIKRCMPFLDAMSLGWLLPLAADVQITTSVNEGNDDPGFSKVDWVIPAEKSVNDNGLGISILEYHTQAQISSEASPNPALPRPPLKFINHWLIKTKPGWSVLFVPPLNRPNPNFECIAGVVDTDGYFEYVNFPFFFNTPNFQGIIPAGTPLVQAIPFKRKNHSKKKLIRAMTDEDFKELNKTRDRRKIHESHYKDNIWTKK